MVTKRAMCIVIAVRLLMAFLSQSWYVPDETWQSVEVAHHLVFHTGVTTWEWSERIRSTLHPLLFAMPLFAVKTLGLTDSWHSQYMVVILPKLVQAVLTSLCEISLLKSVDSTEDKSVASWFFLLLTFNWHGLYAGSRTLINTIEYSLTCLGISLFISARKKHSLDFLPIVSLCFMLRPTSALLWAPLILIRLNSALRSGNYSKILRVGLVCVFVVGACVLVDSLYYGALTLTPLNFFIVNVYHNLGTNYGIHPWHWYASNGLPSLLGPFVVPLLQGLRRAPLFLVMPLATNMLFLSCLPHKEMRFLQSSLPFLLLVVSRHINSYKYLMQRVWKIVFLVGNIVLALYLSLLHQRGVVDAALWLGQQGHLMSASGKDFSVLFLMPCHSTPLYSHIHTNITTRFLHCEPNLSGSTNYTEEADQFYADPVKWLEVNLQSSTKPTHLVMFDVLEKEVSKLLWTHGYQVCASFFHTHFPEGRLGGSVQISCLNQPG